MLDEYPKLHRLMELIVSMATRYEPHTVFPDELSARNTLRWRTLQVFIMRKMYSRELENVFLDLTDKHSRLERIRKKTGIETILEPIYESINTTLAMVRQLRRENGSWYLNVNQYLRSCGFFQFSEQELKTALSISDADWRKYVADTDERDIPELIFVSKIVDEAIREQATAELFNRFKSADRKTKQKMRWKLSNLGVTVI